MARYGSIARKAREQLFTFLSPFTGKARRIIVLAVLAFLGLVSPAKSQPIIDQQLVDTVYTYQHTFDSLVLSPFIQPPEGIQYQILSEMPLTIVIDSSHQLPIMIPYQKVAPAFAHRESIRDRQLYDPRQLGYNQIKAASEQKAPSSGLLSSYPDLYKSGSITRGVTVGNRQNLFVNSALNMQLQGAIGDDLNLTAVITDQNIPFQPEGNTQQLRDFDNVYLALEAEKTRVTAGDITIQNSDDPYFLKYYKNQQGFQVNHEGTIADNWSSTTSTSVGIAKGRFASTQLQPIEGVNGPYRLRGANNERFIIIIANSERIFLDGQRLKRGFNEDYIIDYNLGEVTFTSKVVITRFSRLRADFEYTNQSYQRSNIQFSQAFTSEKHRVYMDYFRSSDNPDRSLQFRLSDSVRLALRDIAPTSDGQVLINQTSLAAETEPGNYYVQKDTVIAGEVYRFFEYQQSGDQLLSVAFTETFDGDYQVADQNAFGKIYEFVPPVNGISQGTHSAGIILPLPARQAMFAIGHQSEVGKDFKFYQELAINEHDENLFGNDDERQGLAWTGGLSYDKSINQKTSLNLNIKGEYNSADFLPIDRIRSIEFDRDWSYAFPNDSIGRRELILYTDVAFRSPKHTMIYRNVMRDRESILNGMQQWLSNKHQISKFHYSGNHFLMRNQQSTVSSEWLRSFNELYIATKVGDLGVLHNLDQNLLLDPDSTTTVLGSAMYYTESGFFWRKQAGDQLKTTIQLIDREDGRPINGENTPFTAAQQANLNLDWTSVSKQHKVSISTIYRDTERTDTLMLPNDQIAQGSLRLLNKWWSGAVVSNLNLMSQNSQELRRDYIYTQVGAGQGTHTWRDENNNGTPEINEFYEAINHDEKNYIRLFVPTDDYLQAYAIQFQHGINWRIPRQMNLPKLLNPVKRLSGLINWNINSKTTSSDLQFRLNPFAEVPDNDLITKRDLRTYAIFYNRNKPGLGFSVNQTSTINKQLNVNGFEFDKRSSMTYSIRYLFKSKIQLAVNATDGLHQHEADFLQGRSFLIDRRRYEIENSWLPNANARISVGYVYKDNQNILQESSTEFIRSQELVTKIALIAAGKRNISLQLSYIDNDFEGELNSFLGYTLLEGLQPGSNVRLQTNLNQTLSNGLQLSLTYFGRKSENQPVIHSGSASLTAFF